MRRRRIKEKSIPWLFIGPSVAGVAIFYMIPYVEVLKYSFFSNVQNGQFIGVDNYLRVLRNTAFQQACVNTLVFMFIGIGILLPLALLCAMQIRKLPIMERVVKASFLVPLAIPVVSIILFFDIVFDDLGAMNKLLSLVGLDPVQWSQGWASLAVVVIVFVWKNIGYSIIIFLAGLSNIPKEYYEVAEIEGANAIQSFWHVTRVYVTPAFFVALLFSILGSFKVFREVFVLYGNYPSARVYMLQHYMNNLFRKLAYPQLVTAAIVMSIGIYALILLFFLTQEKLITRIGGGDG